MTAEGLRLSLAYPHGDGVSESKWVGWCWGLGVEGIYAVPSSQGPVMDGGGGGLAVPQALGDRYRQELRRQNLHS